MITLKSTRKAQRRQRELGAVLQLEKIEKHLEGYREQGESPALAVKRLIEEWREWRRFQSDVAECAGGSGGGALDKAAA